MMIKDHTQNSPAASTGSIPLVAPMTSTTRIAIDRALRHMLKIERLSDGAASTARIAALSRVRDLMRAHVDHSPIDMRQLLAGLVAAQKDALATPAARHESAAIAGAIDAIVTVLRIRGNDPGPAFDTAC